MNIRILTPLAVALTLFLASPADAGLFTKTFKFKPDTTLEVGADIDGGVRLDTVRFKFPATTEGGKLTRAAGLVKADVAVSNLGTSARTIGVAIALLDDDGRLLAVGSGGTKLFPLRKERQIVYTLVFDGVNSEATKATVFKISLEPKP